MPKKPQPPDYDKGLAIIEAIFAEEDDLARRFGHRVTYKVQTVQMAIRVPPSAYGTAQTTQRTPERP